MKGYVSCSSFRQNQLTKVYMLYIGKGEGIYRDEDHQKVKNED